MINRLVVVADEGLGTRQGFWVRKYDHRRGRSRLRARASLMKGIGFYLFILKFYIAC
jgi:hypothetical protein